MSLWRNWQNICLRTIEANIFNKSSVFCIVNRYRRRLIHLCAPNYIKVNDFDFSCEPNDGPGPVDFKISRGNDKTVIEIKLSSNQDYLNGYQNQVKRYADAENTDNMVYVFIDVGNPGRRRTLEVAHENDLISGNRIPEVVIIDANEQLSASKRR